MAEHLLQMFENRLKKVDKHFGKLARRKSVRCFRIYDRDLPEFPYCIERFEDSLVVWKFQTKRKLTEQEDKQESFRAIQTICNVLDVPRERLHFKVRRRKDGLQNQYQKLDQSDSRKEVSEGGLIFRVNLKDYLDTGLFLDHRDTRARVRELAKGLRVLNLYCYTGAFSVYAADGRAASVTSVDLSNQYLGIAEGNMKVNGLWDEQRHHFVKSDVMKFLSNCQPNSFDLVVLDPPTFSNSKSMDYTFDIQRDHVKLIRAVLRVMASGGRIIFSTNCRNFKLETDRLKAAPFEGCSVKDVTKSSIPFDFKDRHKRWCFDLLLP